MRIILIFNLVALVLLAACSHEVKDEPIARVHDKILYRSTLKSELPHSLNVGDSTKRAEIYVNDWVREQVVVYQAGLNLKINDDAYAKRLEDYKNELIIYDYQNLLIQQKLDNKVTFQDKQDYYKRYNDNFVLKNKIIKLRYAIFEDGINDLKQFGRWMRSDGEEENLKNFARDKALQFSIGEEKWYELEDLEGIIPLEGINMTEVLRGNGYKYINRDNKEYFLRVLDYKMEGDVAPFELVSDKIESTIINHRKIDLLKNMREDLYQEASKQGEVELYK